MRQDAGITLMSKKSLVLGEIQPFMSICCTTLRAALEHSRLLNQSYLDNAITKVKLLEGLFVRKNKKSVREDSPLQILHGTSANTSRSSHDHPKKVTCVRSQVENLQR